MTSKLELTREQLTKLNACRKGLDWYDKQGITNLEEICARLLDAHPNWANWLLVRLMNKKQKVQYAIFSAEQVIDIFESKYPDDKRPRQAIEAAKTWLINPSSVGATAAYAAADAAYAAAADAAYAAAADAYAAADAAADAAAADAAAARKDLQTRIVNYGLDLLKDSHDIKA